MKQLKRVCMLLAALVVFLMSNSIPLVALANSWTPAPLAPGKWEMDPWEVDEWKIPEWKTPEISTPEWTAPIWNNPEWTLPPSAVDPLNPDSLTPPEWNPSDPNSLNEWGVHPLTVEVWQAEMGTPTNPYPVLQFQWWLEQQLTDPSLSHLNLQNYSLSQNTVGENSLNPPQGIEGRSSPLDALTGYDPYGQQFTTYDGVKFALGDVPLGLIGFTTGMLQGEIDGVSPGRGFLTSQGLAGIFVNSIKTVGASTGNAWVQGAGDLSDTGLKAWQSVDTLNKAKTAITTFNQGWDDIARAGSSRIPSMFSSTSATGTFGTLAKFNVATGVIGAGFSGYETYKNWSAWKNESNFTAKTDLAGKMTTSAGNTLLSAGVAIAAVPIPGLQVVGGALVATGAVLAVGGMALQWSNKTETGRKIIAGTVNGVKNIGKSIGKGFKRLFGRG